MAETMTQTKETVKQSEKAKSERKEISISFGKGMVEDSFMTKSGTEMMSIRIPNQDSEDKRPWEKFAVPAKMIRTSQFGKGLYMKLPKDGTTKLTRSVLQGKDENGKNIWGSETRFVSNTELKSMMESYKEQSKDSVLADLGEKKEAVSKASKEDISIGVNEEISVVPKEETKAATKREPKKTKGAER